MRPLRRFEGDAGVRRVLETWCAGGPAECVRDGRARRILRLEGGEAGTLAVKHFRPRGGGHPVRERLKAWIGLAPARREWRRLVALRGAGVPVPEPLAFAACAGGDPLLATRWIAGDALLPALARGPRERRRILEALGRAVGALHAAGFVHRDLHHGNVRVAGDAVVLLDVGRARRTPGRAARLRDLGWLDDSLRGALSRADRVRLRAAALGLGRPFDARARALLRAVGVRSERRADRHARSRTRRSLRPGRLYARAAVGGRRGMRMRALPADDLARALAGHAAAVEQADARLLQADPRSRISALALGDARVVVKESPWRGLARALADAARGSAARRAWLGGHGLAARRIGAARPLAFLERHVAGVPVASWLVLEDLRPGEPADACRDLDPGAVVLALGRLAVALHRRRIDHGDLKASHVFVRSRSGEIETRLLDLDGVRFPRRLPEARRLQALAELNASLPDRFPDAARRVAFRRYASALPFRGGSETALREVVARSLARRHRWTGGSCNP